VKTYKSAKKYQKDVPKMTADGWAVQSTLEHTPRSFRIIGAPKELVVTYTRKQQLNCNQCSDTVPPGSIFFPHCGRKGGDPLP
jgi:hypothetical protein